MSCKTLGFYCRPLVYSILLCMLSLKSFDQLYSFSYLSLILILNTHHIYDLCSMEVMNMHRLLIGCIRGRGIIKELASFKSRRVSQNHETKIFDRFWNMTFHSLIKMQIHDMKYCTVKSLFLLTLCLLITGFHLIFLKKNICFQTGTLWA